ncbi:MAG: alpha/beta hydrolase fold domain-containing protein [Rhodobacteraceae bacterium]|nr:alpha/beta hydrolase fold domain-containing protein [Paracoccaceae bacterium]
MDLSDAYANGPYIAGADAFPPRWAAEAARFREELGDRARLDLDYGAGARHQFDLFLPEETPKGVFVFVHGGYWMAFDKSSWSNLAAGLMAHGWAVAMPSYDLCPQVRIADITRQIAAAVTRIAQEVAGPILLAGHSAGGHLVARMTGRDVLPAEVGERLQTVMPISPLSDLRPLMQTGMNEKFQMDLQAAESESPILMQDRYDAQVVVWVGGDERPSFLDQAHWLAESWGAGHVVADGKHHFDVIEPLADPESDMVRTLLGEN